LTERARLEACRRVGQDGHSVAQVAAEFGVAWATVMAAVVEYGTPLVDDPARHANANANARIVMPAPARKQQTRPAH
jgi:hypothetical protein